MKYIVSISLLFLSTFMFMVPSVMAQRYTGDDTLFNLNEGDEIKSNNGLIFSPTFDLTGQFPKIVYQVFDGRAGQNEVFLGSTATYQIGDKEIVQFAGVSVELWTYNTGVLNGEPWVEVRVKSMASAEEFSVSNIQVTNLQFRYPLVAPSITFDASIQIKLPRIIYCKAIPNCSNQEDAIGNNFFATNHAVTLGKGLENNSVYYYKIQGTTEAGEIAEDDNNGNWYSFQTSPPPTAPIQNLSVNVGDTGADILFETTDNYYVIIDYGISSVNEFQKAPLAFAKNHVVGLTNLQKGITYRYRITLQRADDLTSYSQSGEFTFSTKASLVQFSGIVEMTASRSANITWNTDISCQGEVWYRLKGNQNHTIVVEENFLKSHWGKLTGLVPSSTYEYRLGCVIINDGRKALHPENLSEWLEFNTTQVTQIEEEQISSIQQRVLAPDTVEVTWSTEAQLDCSVVYSDVRDPVDDSISSELKKTINHSSTLRIATLQPLVSNRTYYVRIVCRDANTNEIRAKSSMFTVTGPATQWPQSPVEDGQSTVDQRIQSLNITVTEIERAVINKETSLTTQVDENITERLKGKILLQVEENGEAWYIEEETGKRYYLKDGARAYDFLRAFGLGISNQDLEQIPIGIEERADRIDTDNDGVDDKLEDALGTDKNLPDSDGDGFLDFEEIVNGYNPNGSGRMPLTNLGDSLEGKILLQVESRGEAWYVHNGKRYYMKDGDAAYQIMRFLSLGITNDDLRKIFVGKFD